MGGLSAFLAWKVRLLKLPLGGVIWVYHDLVAKWGYTISGLPSSFKNATGVAKGSAICAIGMVNLPLITNLKFSRAVEGENILKLPRPTLLVIACMAWFRRRQGYLSCDNFSVTPVFRTESMLLLKFTCIFLKAPSRKQFFFYFPWRALVRNRTLMISCLCNVLFTRVTAWHHFGFAECSRSWDILENIRTNKHACIHTNMTWDRFPSFVGLRLRAFGAQSPSE